MGNITTLRYKNIVVAFKSHILLNNFKHNLIICKSLNRKNLLILRKIRFLGFFMIRLIRVILLNRSFRLFLCSLRGLLGLGIIICWWNIFWNRDGGGINRIRQSKRTLCGLRGKRTILWRGWRLNILLMKLHLMYLMSQAARKRLKLNNKLFIIDWKTTFIWPTKKLYSGMSKLIMRWLRKILMMFYLLRFIFIQQNTIKNLRSLWNTTKKSKLRSRRVKRISKEKY